MRTKITQTLLNSWLRVCESDDGYEEFLKVLNREKLPPTQAMLDGTRFEGVVNAVLDGEEIDPEHEWYSVVSQLASLLEGSQKQVCLFRELNADGETYLLNGVLDFLKAGVIYDTKFSRKYHLNKYFASAQHPMYFALVPEAYEFQYLSSDGKYIYTETYRPEDCVPIDIAIAQFRKFIKRNNLEEIYINKWKV